MVKGFVTDTTKKLAKCAGSNMHKKFDHKEIEKKWQQKWRESGIYEVNSRDASKEKEYVLVEWPYPSGNLHIGHWYAFGVPDIYVRAHKMQGKQVIFPYGFDAFGLPAENAAIKRNINPKEWTELNVAHMKEQTNSMGNAFTLNLTCSSTDPEYYKWTQWIFIKFFENDLAYRGKGIVNWCPSCNTVLANEQVIDEHCERCSSFVGKREMDEWKLRITNFADDLLSDLDSINWPEHIKEAQRQWIGRSEGAELTFKLSTADDLQIFTTRPDTLYGATYMVLAPEHELVGKNKKNISNWKEVEKYIIKAAKKGEIERTKEEKEKTGVRLEGMSATNPATGKEIPVFIADYVLVGYGTGAIMAVPAHDHRDYHFALKFDLPIKKVIDRKDKNYPYYEGRGPLMNSGEFDGMEFADARQKITEKVGGKLTYTYRLRDWSIGRQRYWGVPIPIVYDPEGNAHTIPEEHLPWHLPEDVDFRPTGEPPLAKSKELKERVEKIFGKGWAPEVETMDTFVDSSWYFLRYIDNKNEEEFSSKQAQKTWMPVDIYFGGAEHTTMHLLYSRFWQKALYSLGLAEHNEPYKRRINRGLVLGPDGNKMSKSKGNVIDPDEQVTRMGSDTVKMYLAFMGPYGETANYPWDMGGIAGIRRFLERVYGLSEHIVQSEPEFMKQEFQKALKKVHGDIEQYKFHTAISAMMIYVNHAEKEGLSNESYESFLKLLAPFAPHLSEELWSETGKRTSIHLESYPEHDDSLIEEETANIAVQIDGKIRGSLEVSSKSTEKEVMKLVMNDEKLTSKISGEIVKKIYVPGRIISILTNQK